MTKCTLIRLALFVSISLFSVVACGQMPSPEHPKLDPAGSRITSYAECVKAGFAILRTFPAKCITSDGITFVDVPDSKPGGACKNQCGDGTCQQIVCSAVGCPCAETPQNCAGDCT